MFTGFVPEDDLQKYFSASSVIVLPYTETCILGTSEVLAEIALAGKPVIGTRTPKLLGLLRDESNSLLVNPGSVEQLTDAILRVLSDEKLALRLASSLKNDASRNNWTEVGKVTAKIYNQVLGLCDA